jgi:hypothetical protein
MFAKGGPGLGDGDGEAVVTGFGGGGDAGSGEGVGSEEASASSSACAINSKNSPGYAVVVRALQVLRAATQRSIKASRATAVVRSGDAPDTWERSRGSHTIATTQSCRT